MDFGDMARRWQRAAAAGQRARADLEGSGKALKAHGRVSCPGGNVSQRFLNPWKRLWRHGQALGRQWQSAKGPRKGFVSWWTVLHSGFETL